MNEVALAFFSNLEQAFLDSKEFAVAFKQVVSLIESEYFKEKVVTVKNLQQEIDQIIASNELDKHIEVCKTHISVDMMKQVLVLASFSDQFRGFEIMMQVKCQSLFQSVFPKKEVVD